MVPIDTADDSDKAANAPTKTFVRDAKAMAATRADVKEYPKAATPPTISGERKREEEKEGAKYVRMERRVGKVMRKFVLPENANTDAVSAVCQEKLPPPLIARI